MDQVQKDNKKVAVAPIFVKASDMSEELFRSLPKMKATLKKKMTKSGYPRCSLDIEIEKTFLNVTIQLSEARYNFLRLKLNNTVFDKQGRELLEFAYMVPYRFIKGQNSNGEYKSLEIIMGHYLYETYFFNDSNELGTLNILEDTKKLNIQWYERPDKVDLTQTVNSHWEE